MKKTILLLSLIAVVVSLITAPDVAVSAPLDDIYCQAAEESGWANHALNMSCLFIMQAQGYEGETWPPTQQP